MGTLLSFLLTGTVYAAELALITLSFSLTYRAIGFVNFAHVEFVALGAMVAVVVAEHFPIWVGLLVGMVVTGAVAVGIDLSIFRRLVSVPVGTRMIASAGVSLVMQAGIQYFWGVQPRLFQQNNSGPTIAGVVVEYGQIAVIVTAAIVLLGFQLLMRRTSVGRLIRATADSRDLAEARGVSSKRVVTAVWFVSGALAALGGGLLGFQTVVSPSLGQNILIPMFAAAVLGGLGSAGGAVVGAIILSYGQTGLLLINFGAIFASGSWFVPSEYGSVLAFFVLIGVLLFRPKGIFPPAEARA